jgi:hypothetical protein
MFRSCGSLVVFVLPRNEMRCIALLATSLGILLHAVLGWCSQHAGCAMAAREASVPSGHSHQHCQGHLHGATQQHSDTATDNRQVPGDSVPAEHGPHSCDHADCLFVSFVESDQQVATPPVDSILFFQFIDLYSAIQLVELREHSSRLLLPCSQGQSARIARCVWLI